MTRIQGLWLPLITPFLDGEVDLASFRRLVRHYAVQPLDGLIVAATTGEGSSLEDGEVAAMIAAAREELAAMGRAMPLYAGASGSATAKLCRALRRLADLGVDGTLVASPPFVRPSQEGLFRHFEALAGAIDLPLIVYDIPYRAAVGLSAETILRLADLPNVVAVKDCHADAGHTFDLIRGRPEGFAVMTGEDAAFHSALSMGADGAILASAHIATAEFARLYRLMAAGEGGEALALWRQLADLPRLLFAEPNPAPIKHWLWRAGLIASPEPRQPLVGVTPALAGRLDAARRDRPGW